MYIFRQSSQCSLIITVWGGGGWGGCKGWELCLILLPLFLSFDRKLLLCYQRLVHCLRMFVFDKFKLVFHGLFLPPSHCHNLPHPTQFPTSNPSLHHYSPPTQSPTTKIYYYFLFLNLIFKTAPKILFLKLRLKSYF
jgi:hypothetical protein